MGMTTVSRRLVTIKLKKTHKPHVPLPKRSASDGMVGEKALPFVAFVAIPRMLPPRTWWQKTWRPAAISLGALVFGAALYFLIGASSRPSANRAVETMSSSAVSSSSLRAARSQGHRGEASAYPGGAAITENIVLSNRSGPTDESFLATAYVRRKVMPAEGKVSLPHLSGTCVVNSSGDSDIGACLRRQMEE